MNIGMVVATPKSGGVDVPATLRSHEIADNDLDLAMANMSLRHTRCGRYCQRTAQKQVCRFQFPRDLSGGDKGAEVGSMWSHTLECGASKE
jgi:hypothetical protein